MVTFIPDMPKAQELRVPFFEDITAQDIPGCKTGKPVAKLQDEIIHLLARMGGGMVTFISGKVEGKPVRYGYQIHFYYGAAKGRIDCVALPLRSETPNKKDRALAQALYLVRNSLEAQLFAKFYQPGYEPIVPYLIDDKGVTVMQALVERGMLPMLASGS